MKQKTTSRSRPVTIRDTFSGYTPHSATFPFSVTHGKTAMAIGVVAVVECRKNGDDAALMVPMPPRDADRRTLPSMPNYLFFINNTLLLVVLNIIQSIKWHRNKKNRTISFFD